MQVVLPAPLVPTSPKISPARTSSERSSSTERRPSRLDTPENTIAFGRDARRSGSADLHLTCGGSVR